MAMYTLSINIHSSCQETLDKLLITLESIEGDPSALKSVDLLTVSGPVCLDYRRSDQDSPFTVTQRNLFLDGWAVNDAG